MKVREIMTRDVATVAPDTAVRDIALLMIARGVTGLPVVTPAGRVVGVVTELDLIARTGRLEPPAFFRILDGWMPLESPGHYRQRLHQSLGPVAREIMTAPVVSVAPEASLESLAELLMRQRVNPVPVIDAGRLVGIVSRADVVRMLGREVEAGAASAA